MIENNISEGRNTMIENNISGCSLSNGNITLPAGKYKISACNQEDKKMTKEEIELEIGRRAYQIEINLREIKEITFDLKNENKQLKEEIEAYTTKLSAMETEAYA